METTVNSFEPRRSTMTMRLGLTLFSRCRDALREWRKRGRMRAELDGLSDRELLDIGIARGEIDYVASNRIDPRSAFFLPRAEPRARLF